MEKSENPIDYLPEALWFRIFKIGIQKPILELKDIASLSISCEFFNKLLNEDALWSLLIAQDFPQSANDEQTPKKLLYKHTLGRRLRSKIDSAQVKLRNVEDLLEHTLTWIARIRELILEVVSPKMEKLSQDLLGLVKAGCSGRVQLSFDEAQTLLIFRARIDEVREASIAAVNKTHSGQGPFASLSDITTTPFSKSIGPKSLTPSSLVHLETKGNEMVSDSWNVVSEHQFGRCLIETLLRGKREYAHQLETFSSRLAFLTSGPNPIEISDEVDVDINDGEYDGDGVGDGDWNNNEDSD